MADASFWPELPTGNALFVFVACLIIGGFVVYRYCLDQFDTPDGNANENDPWKFLVPSLLTDRRQYLLGFSVYCGLMMLIYLSLSFAGPKLLLGIAKAVHGTSAEVVGGLQDYSTFPIVVAFIIIGLYPQLSLPRGLDLEVTIRRLAHRIAYIPKNMDRLFNHMRFSEFDLAPDRVAEAWSLVDLKRPTLDAPDLKSIAPLLDRLALLYVRAAALTGDLESQDAAYMRSEIELAVFKQFRSKVADVLVGLEALHARQTELDKLGPADRRKAILSGQRDLIKSLEFLYVIFACALTVKGMDRLTERLRTIGFTTAFPPEPGTPWNPILNVVLPSALVLVVACSVLADNFQDTAKQLNMPTTNLQIGQLMLTVLAVYSTTIAASLALRARLIGTERYYSETGSATVMALLMIFIRCFIISTVWLLLIYANNLVKDLTPDGQRSQGDVLSLYLTSSVVWSIVPGVSGVMTAITIDRAAGTRFDRVISGIMQGAAMATAAILATKLTTQPSNDAPGSTHLAAYIFYAVVYGGLGFVFGYMLPAAVRRYWQAQQHRMPDRITVLRTSVLRYFHDIQEFTEWLYAQNPALDGKRPLDVIVEETGVQRLIAFVGETRKPITAA